MATKEEVIGVLRKCYDPEIPINIYDLGLVYNIDLKPDEGKIDVKMTLTAPGCPASAYIHQDVKRKLEQLQGVKEAVVNIVWEPPWTPEMMSETAKKQFGWGIIMILHLRQSKTEQHMIELQSPDQLDRRPLRGTKNTKIKQL